MRVLCVRQKTCCWGVLSKSGLYRKSVDVLISWERRKCPNLMQQTRVHSFTRNKDDTATQKYKDSKIKKKTIEISCTPQYNKMYNTEIHLKPSNQTTAARRRQMIHGSPGRVKMESSIDRCHQMWGRFRGYVLTWSSLVGIMLPPE